MSIKASLPPDVAPPYSGNLIESLVSAVDSAHTRAQASPTPKTSPTLIHKQDGRNYLRLTEIPSHAELRCATADCDNQARLLLDSRDAEVLAYCEKCARVEFAMWMVGV